MKYRKKVPEQVREHWVETRTECDICHQDVKHDRDSWDGSDIEIEAKIGSIYPEADVRDGYRVDVCNTCFLNKVIPAIHALGATWTEFSAEETSLYSDYSRDYYKEDSKADRDIG